MPIFLFFATLVFMNMTKDNWNYCFYKTKDLKAFISLGAMPDHQNEDKAQLVHCVTLSDFSHKELYQEEFEQLDDAVKFIKKKYGHWEFENPLVPKESSGCTDCSAH